MISKLPKWVWEGAAVLSFAAGMINVIAIQGFTHEAATHMTGIVSLFSISMTKGEAPAAYQTLVTLLAFFAGAFLSGMLVRDAHLRMGRRYGVALGIEFALLLLSTWGFVKGSMWGEYGAAMAAGLQNAMASTYSGTIVRTTHLTGVLTDLGALVGNGAAGVPVDRKRFKLLAIIFLSFVTGGFMGTLAYVRFGSYAMLAPAAVIGATSLGYTFFRKRLAAAA